MKNRTLEFPMAYYTFNSASRSTVGTRSSPSCWPSFRSHPSSVLARSKIKPRRSSHIFVLHRHIPAVLFYFVSLLCTERCQAGTSGYYNYSFLFKTLAWENITERNLSTQPLHRDETHTQRKKTQKPRRPQSQLSKTFFFTLSLTNFD